MIKSTQRIKTVTPKTQKAKNNKKSARRVLKGSLKKDLVNTPVKRKTKPARRSNKAKDSTKNKSMRSISLKKCTRRSPMKKRNSDYDLNNNGNITSTHGNSRLVQHFRELLKQKELYFQKFLQKDTSHECSSEEEKIIVRNSVEIPILKLKYVQNSVDSEDITQHEHPEDNNDLQESVTDLSEILGSSNISSRSLSAIQ